MLQADSLCWQDLPGNKYSKAIDAAMLSEAGYIASQRVRKSHERKGKLCNVVYDKSYVLEIVARKIIRPLYGIGKDKMLDLVAEAWQLFEEGLIANN